MSRVVLYCIVSFIVCCLRRTARGTLTLFHTLALGVLLLFSIGQAKAQGVDTVQRLEEVTVSTQRTPATLRTAVPTQVMEATQMERLGALQLSDALKQMAGVTLKDYGGVGGIKTVSARGLGSQFSAVTIDGVPVDDSQNGQVDLGRYTLGNAAYVSFSQGQEQASLLSARAYAAGNVLNMETAAPQFYTGERTRMKAGMEAGSFGLLSPTLLWQQKWSRKLSTSLFAHYLRSDGDYPFTLYYTASHQDSSSTERRRHSAVWMATVDGTFFYTLAPGNTLTAKVYYLKGEHELPGPVSYYSQAISGQRSTEEVCYVQTRWRIEREQWKSQLLGKVRYSDDQFFDTERNEHDTYHQQEAYISGSHIHSLTQWLEASMAADASLSHLHSLHQPAMDSHDKVKRTNLSAVLSLHAWTELGTHKLDLNAHALYTHITDHVADLDTTPAYRRLSPYLSAMLTLRKGTTVRLFYKQTYRTPNFGEMYFFQFLPRALRPEHAHQANLGITHAQNIQLSTSNLQFTTTLDVYYNHVKDKIVAKPTSNMYYWSMENFGIVDIMGIDATASVQFTRYNIHLNYTFQHAVDHTKPGSRTYGHQIMYTPRHSGGVSVTRDGRWVNLGGTAMLVGYRYHSRQNTPDSRMPAYCDLGLSADRKFDLRLGTLCLRASVHNLLNTQYEVVASYPMMGRNWRLAVTYEF